MREGRTYFVAAALLAACSTFDASPATPAVDAGDDSSLDAALADTGAPEDAGADVRPPFCATLKGTFCEDFDDPKGGSFTGMDIPDGGTQRVVADPHFSPPNALRTTLRRPPAGPCQDLLLYSLMNTQAAGGFRAEFKVRPAALPSGAYVGVGVTTKNLSGPERCSFFFKVSDLNTELFIAKEDGGSFIHKLDRKVLTGEWSHVELEVTGAPGFRVMTAKVDGVLGIADVQAPAPCQNDTILTGVDVGLRCIYDTIGGDIDIAFDDVRVIAR